MSMAIVATVMAGIGVVTGAAQQMAAGKKEHQIGQYRQAVAERNALLTRQQKDRVLKQGDRDAYDHGRKVARLVGAQRGAFAGGNVIVDQDTAGGVTSDTIGAGREDQLRILSNADNRAYDLEVEALSHQAQGNFAAWEGRETKRMATRSALVSLVTGVGTVASKWQTMGGSPGGGTPGKDLGGSVISSGRSGSMGGSPGGTR